MNKPEVTILGWGRGGPKALVREGRIEPPLTLRQVYFSRDRRAAGAGQDALDLLQRISRDGPEAEFEQFGDPLPLPARIEGLRESEVARLFGGEFPTPCRAWSRAIGPARWSPASACIWSSSKSARRGAFRNWRKCGTRCCASGRASAAAQRSISQFERLAGNYTIEIEPLLNSQAEPDQSDKP